MFKNILVPLDGSEMAEHALKPALKIAQTTGAQVHLVRSLIPVHMMMPDYAAEQDWVWPAQSLEWSRFEAREYLEAVSEAQHSAGVPLVRHVLEGDEASAVLDAVETESADLIVMTSHGRSGVKRWKLGSVTERVLQHAPCPVLVMRGSMTWPIQRILIPLDGSEMAEEALQTGIDVARSFGARVTLIHIIPPAILPGQRAVEYEWLERESGRYIEQSAHDYAESYLATTARRYLHQAIDIDEVTLDGDVVDQLLAFIEDEGIDLVAMTTHGRTGLRRWLYGSVTAKVMRGSECSMLIVRPRGRRL